ncbi:cytochrome-c peroxidase [Sorangium sp. So ce1153]|uniref:cytochrome-c peroxidase n=1 Tax=Sorangium sp. So ce1153 TaxID=3133333 RepID=UPI003F645ABB
MIARACSGGPRTRGLGAVIAGTLVGLSMTAGCSEGHFEPEGSGGNEPQGSAGQGPQGSGGQGPQGSGGADPGPGSSLAAGGSSPPVAPGSGEPPPSYPPDDAAAPAPVHPPPTIGSLRGVRVPEPDNLSRYVKDREKAVALGKALFWDMQAGSDGVACATCHFHAGADHRKRNQLSPGLANQDPERRERFDSLASGSRGGPNFALQASDWPLFRLADPDDRESDVLFQTDDVVSSQGVFHARFNAVVRGDAKDDCTLLPDIFQVQGLNVRRVEPRHTPTVINAAFNYRNFWDGRANNHFNGVNPFGRRDPDAAVHALRDGVLVREEVDLDNSSLASQAVGPPLSPFEMSCEGRTFPDIGRKLLKLRPLAGQGVDPTDSVLGALRHPSGNGLAPSYRELIEGAFADAYWRPDQRIDDRPLVEANFSLFWGLAIQLYEATLVSDDTRFDRFADGDSAALSDKERAGLAIFEGKGKCINCHRGPELTGAATHLQDEAEEGGLIERMLMGDGRPALYDNGFYNIGVRPTEEDVGVGGLDPFGNPLSFTRQGERLAAGQDVPDPFRIDPASFEVAPGAPIDRRERDAVDGAFKVPTLRNVALTGPYFHNGSALTLAQVVEFYNRGGNRRDREDGDTTGFGPNRTNLDPDIQPLGLTDGEKEALVAFLEALTDERVRFEQAPFDHPQLFVADGHFWNEWTAVDDGTGRAREKIKEIPAVGAEGRRAKNLPGLEPFSPL